MAQENTEEYRAESSRRTTHGTGAQKIKLTCIPRPPKKIIPVIFIPGIFGSRLENPDGKNEKSCYVWDPNRKGLLISSYAAFSSTVADLTVSDKEIHAKVTRLHNDKAVVMKDHRHKGPSGKNYNDAIINKILGSNIFWKLAKQRDITDAFQKKNNYSGNRWEETVDEKTVWSQLAKDLAKEEYKRRSERGWYGVIDDYEPFVEAIHERDDAEFIYPVFPFGYDWRFDLVDPAKKLVAKINSVKAQTEYPEYGEQCKDYEVHDKVIIITHSQGSIMSRYALTKLGAEADVDAVIHMDQPTTGAPVLYRRFITGTGPERTPFGMTNNVFLAILGSTPYHFTRMAGPLTGALALLPTNDYLADKNGASFKWLKTEGKELAFEKPITDVYEDIYKSEKYGLINCKRYDSHGNPNPYQSGEFDIVQSTYEAGGETKTWQQPRHTLKPDELSTLKNVTILPQPLDSPFMCDNQRLRPYVGMPQESLTKAIDDWKKITTKIDAVKNFHASLSLAQHNNTHIIRSRSVDTVTAVTFNLKDGLLICPLEIGKSKEGDGTVPLTSQEALIHQGDKTGKPAGGGEKGIIQGGEHAAICTHEVAMKQVFALLQGEFVDKLRPAKQVNKT